MTRHLALKRFAGAAAAVPRQAVTTAVKIIAPY
jgi:hypothetical protein